jgi:surface antigen
MSYFGHVAIVESVSADGTTMEYSDMNGLPGYFGIVRFSGPVPITRFLWYIYR